MRVLTDKMRDVAIRAIGCLCCLRFGHSTPCAKHHLLDSGRHGNGRRRGEQDTIGLCDYHHQGAQVVGTGTAAAYRAEVGPSYADEPAEFRRVFGSDDELLAEQNRRITIWRESFVSGVGA